MWKQGIYHNIHGIYRYIPCMNRVSTNPKCTYIFFNFDAITMSSHVTSMRECTNIGKSPWNVIKLLYVYTAIRIVYRYMHFLKHGYTSICIVYRRTAGGKDSISKPGYYYDTLLLFEYIIPIMTLLWHYYCHYYFYKSLTIITHYYNIPDSTIIALMTVLLLPLLLFESIMTLIAIITLLFSLFVFKILWHL